mgnify:CR=1 FL=1
MLRHAREYLREMKQVLLHRVRSFRHEKFLHIPEGNVQGGKCIHRHATQYERWHYRTTPVQAE